MRTMGRELWITVLSFLMLILSLSVSQPNVNSRHILQVQRYFIELYQQYERNDSAVKLELFMDFQLMKRTNGIINLIRGWSYNESEEAINVRMSINCIRSIVLYACIVYADSLYDSYFSTGGLDIDAALYATQIYQISSNFVWAPEPSDEIVRFELASFYQFGIRTRAVNDAPYVQFISTNTESARFFYDMFAYDTQLPLHSINFMPLRQNPQSNLMCEVEMLNEVQKVVLEWNRLRNNQIKILRYQLFLLNPVLKCAEKELIENFARAYNMTTITQYRKRDAMKLISLVLLKQYIQFVRAEYDRHVHHPAHIKYAYVLSANLTTMVNENHIKLEEVNQEVSVALNALLSRNDFLFSFNSCLSALPLRVGYVQYDGHLTLRIELACQNQAEN